jgi:cell division protein FtsA
MEEIIAQVYFELEASGMLSQLGAGIVLTGGGALLKNLSQLVAFKTGMDVRLGLPNQTVQSKTVDEVNQPIFATGVGLMLTGFRDRNEDNCVLSIDEVNAKEAVKNEKEEKEVELEVKEVEEETNVTKNNSKTKKTSITKNVLDKFSSFFNVDDDKM